MLSEINPLLVEKYKKTRKEEEADPATINRELGCLRHMFNMAIAWGKAQDYPFGFGKNKVKSLMKPKGNDRALSEEEEKRLPEAVILTTKSQHLEPIIITAMNTGMRNGKILNLKLVKRGFQDGHILVEETKNGKIWKIPMNQKLTATLESGKKVSRGEYVFSENGKPYQGVKTGWWPALKKAKIEGFRFHDLRHTFGSRLGMAGIDIRTIQELMGHKDIKMTMRYLHPTPEHKKNVVKVLDGVTTFFTTVDRNPDSYKVVSIGNR
jgi:integrase